MVVEGGAGAMAGSDGVAEEGVCDAESLVCWC